MHDIVSLVLGGGRGSRLLPLTSYRSKPAVPLAGKYRLIDIPISNCLHSGIRRIYVLTQFLSVSLHRHIRGTYQFDHIAGGFVELLAAQQTMDEGADWYQGTADAVRKNLRYIQQPGVSKVLILSGDQMYRMDYRQMLATHEAAGAEVTIAAKPVPRSAASELGIIRCDATGRVEGFLEKPQSDEELQHVQMNTQWLNQQGVISPADLDDDDHYLASLGIYLFDRDTLVAALEKTDYQDFGKEVFPASIRSRHVQVHPFNGYWEDIGTIRSFYEANLALAGEHSPFELYSALSPIYSRPRFLPPTSIQSAEIERSLIADGCVIGHGARIENSVIGLRCRIGNGATIRNSILMGADYFESAAPDTRGGVAGIGEQAYIDGAIIDKNCQIGKGARIVASEAPPDSADERYVLRDGILVAPKGVVFPDHWRPT